jgi:nucleoside-diphosphate-sugar epimerase
MVAVTGASGLLGRQIVERLLAEGRSVIAVVRDSGIRFPESVVVRKADIMDPPALEAAFDGATTVIHAAAMVSFNPRRRKEIMDVNVTGTQNVVNVCLQSGISHLIHISSVAALGRKPGEVVTEDHAWTGLYASDYATSKYLAELEVFRGGEEGLTVGLVNPSVILSGSQPHRSSATLLDYVWKQRPFVTAGNLNYVDVRDVCEAVMELLKKPQSGERFILSAGNISYKAFFGMVAKHWKKRPPGITIPSSLVSLFGVAEELRSFLMGKEPLVTRQSAMMTVRGFTYNNGKAQRILGLRFRTLEETVSWCCDQYMQNVSSNK